MSSNSSNLPHKPDEAAQDKRQPLQWRRVGIVAGIVAWAFFGFMLAQALGFACIAALQWAGVPLENIDQSIFNAVANFIIYSLAITIIIGVPWWIKKRKTTLVDLGLQRAPKWMDFVWLIAGIFVYLVLTAIVTGTAMVLFPQGDYMEAQDVGFTALTNNWQFVLAFASLVIVAPVAEEVIFRGYLFGKLQKHAATWLAVILSAALFSIAHWQFNVSLDTFALGIVLALSRVVSGSIWPAILIHMLKNGVAFYFLFVNPLVL